MSTLLSAPNDTERLDRLYRLLPTVHRLRDHEQGQPLRALLQVIAEQLAHVEDDIEQLYENWFIETCDDWAVAYLADLIGHESVAGTTPLSGDVPPVLNPRREVAHTVRYRLRKGTLAALDGLASDVAGLPAVAVEFGRRLSRMAPVRGLSPSAAVTMDLRRGDGLELLGGPFDPALHGVDVRRTGSHRTPGRYNPAGVGVFVWRLRAYPVTRAPACCAEEAGLHCFTFSVLGNDAPLFNRPRAPGACAPEGELAVPAAIDRRRFSEPTEIDGRTVFRPSAAYYGLAQDQGETVAQSLAIWAEDWPPKEADNAQPILRERIVPADLSRWAYVPRQGEVAVDPVLGRIVFPPRQLPKRVHVSYHYGFPADIGGGEYERPLQQEQDAVLIRVRGKQQLQQALGPWRRDPDEAEDTEGPPRHAVIEIADSGVYTLPIDIHLPAGHTLQLRAAQRTRPVIRLLDWRADQPDSLAVTGQAGSRFVLDGVLVAGRGVRLSGELASFTVRHSTLVPGWTLGPDCDPMRPSEPSIELTDTRACVVIEHSIVGSIQVNVDEVAVDPVPICASDSVIDATGADCEGAECEAVGAAGSAFAHVRLRLARCTVIGRIQVHVLELAENSLLLGRVCAARRQIGCVRFCHVMPGSRTPRRFHCQPDLAEAQARAALPAHPTPTQVADAEAAARRRVQPRFTTLRYGRPGYCQLALDGPEEIARGADDESEMGVYHDLYLPQRLARLEARIDEFLPAAFDAGVVQVN